MSSAKGHICFLQACLKIFLGALLSMVTDGIVIGCFAHPPFPPGSSKITFGLLNPLASEWLHRGFCLSLEFPAGKSRSMLSVAAPALGCARVSPLETQDVLCSGFPPPGAPPCLRTAILPTGQRQNRP